MEKSNLKWYMITTISGKEVQVIDALRNRVVSERMEEDFEDFKVMLIPTLTPKEQEKKEAGEAYKVREKNQFPGYIFIKMNMTNEAWFMVRNTQYVTGLVGSSGQRTKPTPVSNLEIRKMERGVAKVRENFEKGIIKTAFKEGAFVEVIDGPNKGLMGKVLENNDETKAATVELTLFERKTPVTVSHKDIKIVD